MRVKLGLPKPIVPIFWGMVFLEATYGAYLGIWPLWIERLGAPITIVGLVLGSSGVIRLIVLAPSAAIANRVGYRRSILICRVVTAVGLVSAAVATHWTHLAAMILFSAVGELAFPLIQSLVAAEAGEQRIRSFAMVFTVGPSVAMAIAPLVSGALVAVWGMRAALLLAAACTLASLYFFWRVEEPASLKRGAHVHESSYRAAFAVPIVGTIAVLLLLTVFSLSLGTAFIPTFLKDVRGMDPAVIATMGAVAALGSAVFGLAVTRIHKLQRSPFAGVAIAVVVSGVGFFIFRSTPIVALLLLGFFCRGGLFSSWAMLSAALGDLTPVAHRARAFALCEMAGGLAYAAGPIVAGPLYTRRATLPFDTAIVLCVLLVPVLVVAQRRITGLPRQYGAVAVDPATPIVPAAPG